MLPLTLCIIAAFILLQLLLQHRPKRTRQRRLLARCLMVGLVSYLVALGLLWYFQPHFLYEPTHTLQTTPDSHNLAYEEVWIPADAQAKKSASLHSWWIPQPQQHIGTLIYFHGAGHNIGYNVSQANWFHWIGLDVLLAEYRGYGLSEGSFPTEASLYEDAEAALRYLKETRSIPVNEIILYGHSLGGAIAINLAIHHPELAGLIVHNTFTTMAEMVARSPLAYLFPVQTILNQHFNSIQKVASLEVPTLFIHAKGDPRIPSEMGQRLYMEAPEPKSLMLPDLNNHSNAAGLYKTKKYLSQIKQFVTDAVENNIITATEFGV